MAPPEGHREELDNVVTFIMGTTNMPKEPWYFPVSVRFFMFCLFRGLGNQTLSPSIAIHGPIHVGTVAVVGGAGISGADK